ncbi:hypothetical protein F0562_019371 [Nyssa sinensis]|uniref:Uncharacterized protein n=1 Tax=Nyssa sinensis TaxID=561372 RepID=A0A5J4ZEW9_9ASTE|nr:hypothetical protein F0562_019371 [Nyssa sinensis]
MMAAAEARAAWQRTANRCFVQEDAKRAPKLACCPSTSSSSKQVDAGPASATDEQDLPSVGFMPLNRNPSYSNLSSDSKWWLQLQPNYGFQRGLMTEQLNTLEAGMETFRAGAVNSTSTLSGIHPQNEVDSMHVDDNINAEPSLDTHCRISATCTKKDPEVRRKELKAIYGTNAQEPLKFNEMLETYELMEIDALDCSVSKQLNEHCFDSESPWIGAEKTEPWWRTADRDELASLVAQRSLNLIENCDLPQPQNTHVKRDPYAHIGHFDHGRGLPPSIDWKVHTSALSHLTVHRRGSLNSGSSFGKQLASVEGPFQYGTDMGIRNSDSTAHKGSTETKISESDPSKAQLLEALRHSQTRAREAEKAANQACAEKEHIVKLFFRQASLLFAYKQWFQLLQLENLYFQIKNNNQPVSTLFPVVLPWMPHKARKLRKRWQKAAKGKGGKRGHPRYDISRGHTDERITGLTGRQQVHYRDPTRHDTRWGLITSMDMWPIEILRILGPLPSTERETRQLEEEMPVMEKLKMFVVQEPVVAASCLIAGIGLFLPAVVRPILDSFETSKQVPQPALGDVVAGMTGKKQG